MTRKEATKIIKDYEVNGCGYCHQGGDEVEEAFKMAIEALEQEPTAKENLVVGDCMKREFIEIVVNYPPADLCTYPEYKGKPYYSILYRDEDSRNHVGFGTYKIEMLSQWIKQYFMSDIQPKPKTGRWISDKYGQHCDQCGNGINTPYKFCPFCGADMREYTKE